MKLPIHLDVASDSVWTTYKAERDACKTVHALVKFVRRWREIFPFRIDQVVINKDVLAVVKSEKPGPKDLIAANIVVPSAIFWAMTNAQKMTVPINTAFIQANGGMEAFQELSDDRADLGIEHPAGRYEIMPSHHPDIGYMIWDYYDNGVAAHCDTQEKAEKIAKLLSAESNIVWGGKDWVERTL